MQAGACARRITACGACDTGRRTRPCRVEDLSNGPDDRWGDRRGRVETRDGRDAPWSPPGSCAAAAPAVAASRVIRRSPSLGGRPAQRKPVAIFVASAPAAAAVRPSAIGHAPDHAVRRPHPASSLTLSPAPALRPAARRHPRRVAPCSSPPARRAAIDHGLRNRDFRSRLLGRLGAAASAGSLPPLGARPRLAAVCPFASWPHHAPRSHIQLLSLEHPD